MSVTLTDHQWDAVKLARDWFEDDQGPRHLSGLGLTLDQLRETTWSYLGKGQDFFCGGYAGTGKSTILPFVINEFGLTPDQVAFCAPTGKAAKVMTAKLRDFGINRVATTIHKLIYMPMSERADSVKAELDALDRHVLFMKSNGDIGTQHVDERIVAMSEAELEREINTRTMDLHRAMDDSQPKFTMRGREEFPEGVRLIVVDEGSMVSDEMAQDLAFYGIPIFVMGDPGQLPPVAADYGFNVDHPEAFLTEIHRQAADNPIIRLATLTRNGVDLDLGDYGDGVQVISRRNDTATLDMDRDAMVLCGTHKKRWALTKKIRAASGYLETGPGAGEPLLVCRNHKKIPSMVNGSIYECMDDYGDLQNGQAEIMLRVQDMEFGDIHEVSCTQGLFEEHYFRKRNAYSASAKAAFIANKRAVHMDFGHVLTCHKSQGSQWDEVIVHDESPAFRDDRYRWLYTAITRAAQRLTIVQ